MNTNLNFYIIEQGRVVKTLSLFLLFSFLSFLIPLPLACASSFGYDDKTTSPFGYDIASNSAQNVTYNYYTTTNGTGNGTMDYTNLAMTNQSNTFSLNQTTNGWWNGLFSFIVDKWFTWNGNSLGFNEALLNSTIDNRISLANISVNGTGNGTVDYTNIAMTNQSNIFQYNQTIKDGIEIIQTINASNKGGIWVDENGTNYY